MDKSKQDKIETISINGEDYIKASSLEVSKPAINTEGKPYVIARCHDAGVHAGYLAEVNKDSRYCILLKSRRLWRWNSPDNTLSGLANNGFYSSQECKLGDEVSRIQLSEYCELIDCTEKAMKLIQEKDKWNFGGSK